MKRIKKRMLFIAVIISIILSGCAGLSDYTYSMAGNYQIFHAGETSILNASGEFIIQANIIGIAWDDDFICAAQQKDETKNLWIIDINADKVYGPLNEEEYKYKYKELNIKKLILKDPKKYRHLEESRK